MINEIAFNNLNIYNVAMCPEDVSDRRRKSSEVGSRFYVV